MSDSDSEVTFRIRNNGLDTENEEVDNRASPEMVQSSENTQNSKDLANILMENINKQFDSFREDNRRNLWELNRELRQEINSIHGHVESLEYRINHSHRERNPSHEHQSANVCSSPVADINDNSRGSPHLNTRNTAHNTRQSLKPQQYSGGENLEEYLSQFEIVAQINGWDYNTKSLYLAGSLSGSARAILTELNAKETRDFDTLVRLLNVRFGSLERSEIYRARLQTRVKGKDETLSEMAQSIRKMTRQAYPMADASMINILALDYFIDAIPDSDTRLRIRELRPKNLNEAETHAIRLEAHRLADKQRSKAIHMISEEDRTVCHTQMLYPAKMADQEGIDIVTLNKSIQALHKTTKNLVDQRNSGFTSNGQNPKPRNRWNGNGNGNNQVFNPYYGKQTQNGQFTQNTNQNRVPNVGNQSFDSQNRKSSRFDTHDYGTSTGSNWNQTQRSRSNVTQRSNFHNPSHTSQSNGGNFQSPPIQGNY